MLPAQRKTEKLHSTPEKRLTPGTWWRFVGDEKIEFPNIAMPEGPLVLLLKEVRVIDGEDHTVILEGHPTWAVTGIKYLYADLLINYVEEPDGAAIREEEIAAVMQRIDSIGIELRNPPAPQILLAAEAKQEKKKETSEEQSSEAALDDKHSAKTDGSLIPQALLPSQDVVKAQAAIEGRIAELGAQQNWMKSKTTEMNNEMTLVGRYQQEKVTATLAGISQEKKKAESLLANVHTMRLFLGEEIDIKHIVKGKSAPSSTPLTFMQRMLYLDEEIYIAGLLDGFDHSNIQDIPEMFGNDPSLVNRMLPYERSVVITRIRASMKPLEDIPRTFSETMQIFNQQEADRRIQIFVRDGENVWMITADQDTSHAERLFPSFEEINSLFEKRNYSFRNKAYETRVISPDHIDYSDARAQHDNRALFYKRFLIILWGLHEREGIFGPFMSKGQNWLEETIHSEFFNFIHDEENVLEDGRLSVQEFISKNNENLRPNSRIAVNWYKAATTETAPAICSVNSSYKTEYKGQFVKKAEIVILRREKESLVATTKIEKHNYTKGGNVVSNAKIIISQPASNIRSSYDYVVNRQAHKTVVANGILLLDNLSIEDLTYYINSRAARKNYTGYIEQFHEARNFLIAEKAEMDAALAGIQYDPEVIKVAAHCWRSENKWIIPTTDKHKAAIVKIAKAMLKASQGLIKGHYEGAVQVSVKSNGAIVWRLPEHGAILPAGLDAPWLLEYTGTGKKGTIVLADPLPSPAEIVMHKTPGFFESLTDRIKAFPEGLLDPKNAQAFDSIMSMDRPIKKITKVLKKDDGDNFLQWMVEDAFFDYKDTSRGIKLGRTRTDIGIITMENNRKENVCFLVSATTYSPSLAFLLNEGEMVVAEADALYMNPACAVEAIRKRIPANIAFYELKKSRQLHNFMEEDIVTRAEIAATFSGMTDEVLSKTEEFSLEALLASYFVDRKRLQHFQTTADWEAAKERSLSLSFFGPESARDILDATYAINKEHASL
jgi:hypothetical protein